MKILLITFFLVGFTTSISAEIYKVAIPDERCGKMCFYWWPILPSVPGWQQDIQNSYHYSANTQAPKGESFSNTESVIYAKALFKPRIPEIKSLSALITDDHNKFKQHTKPIITRLDNLTTAGGQVFESFQFFPKEKGNFERVSYGEEGEFYLVFTLSSRSKEKYESTMSAYLEFLNRYNEKP
ncbi:MAG: hypothetical protein ABW185_02010 [Sedimenticola sp.]